MKTIQQLIDESLVRDKHIRSGKWSPSSFGRCFRNQYWNRKDEPQTNPPDERTLRVFRAGNLFEDFVRELIVGNGTGWKYIGKDPIECDDVKGFGDLECDNEVADIKSQHSRAFWWMTKSKDIKKDKYPNWLQVMYYTREQKKQFGRLVFVSKDDLCIQEYVQPLDHYWLLEIAKELATLRLLWKRQELPPAEPRCYFNTKGESNECKYCNWQDKCKEIENAKT